MRTFRPRWAGSGEMAPFFAEVQLHGRGTGTSGTPPRRQRRTLTGSRRMLTCGTLCRGAIWSGAGELTRLQADSPRADPGKNKQDSHAGLRQQHAQQ